MYKIGTKRMPPSKKFPWASADFADNNSDTKNRNEKNA
jgi:hypothetical protein